MRTAHALELLEATILPFVAVLVNRSGLPNIITMGMVSLRCVQLINIIAQTWPADDCDLCRCGSEAVLPKIPENWAALNASY